MTEEKETDLGTELIVRAILFNEEKKLVLCRVKDANWYFLPGGHIEPYEKVEDALRREMREEVGVDRYDVQGFAGIVENSYKLKGDPKHEINIVFRVTTDEILSSKEDHIEFLAFDLEEIDNLKILPLEMKDVIKGKSIYQNLIMG